MVLEVEDGGSALPTVCDTIVDVILVAARLQALDPQRVKCICFVNEGACRQHADPCHRDRHRNVGRRWIELVNRTYGRRHIINSLPKFRAALWQEQIVSLLCVGAGHEDSLAIVFNEVLLHESNYDQISARYYELVQLDEPAVLHAELAASKHLVVYIRVDRQVQLVVFAYVVRLDRIYERVEHDGLIRSNIVLHGVVRDVNRREDTSRALAYLAGINSVSNHRVLPLGGIRSYLELMRKDSLLRAVRGEPLQGGIVGIRIVIFIDVNNSRCSDITRNLQILECNHSILFDIVFSTFG
mmetsp:Transcript_4565/g.6911  ORF Transcript_4565/g.6911 Transcript_4565/m.6911 type:complete len:298 (+) Transcript_4565:1707-2600(+)